MNTSRRKDHQQHNIHTTYTRHTQWKKQKRDEKKNQPTTKLTNVLKTERDALTMLIPSQRIKERRKNNDSNAEHTLGSRQNSMTIFNELMWRCQSPSKAKPTYTHCECAVRTVHRI